MAQDLKISQLNPLAINADNASLAIEILSVTGKYMIPALISEDGNSTNNKIDIGVLLRVIKNYVDVAADLAVLDLIAAGNLGGGGTTGGTTTGGGTTGENNIDVASALSNLQAQINAINSQSYPVTYIQLKNGDNTSQYLIATGPGVTSPYNINNPIVIPVSGNIVQDNFMVTLSINPPNINENGVSVTVRVGVSADGYLGGRVENIVAIVTLNTSLGPYTYSGEDLSESITLNPGNSVTRDITIQFNVPNNATISDILATCSVSGVNLGTSAHRINNTSIDAQGTIKLTNGS